MFGLKSNDRVSPVVGVVLMVAVTVVLAAVLGTFVVGNVAADYTSDDETHRVIDSTSELEDTKYANSSLMSVSDGVLTVEETLNHQGWVVYDINGSDLESADTLRIDYTDVTTDGTSSIEVWVQADGDGDGNPGTTVDNYAISSDGVWTADISTVDVNESKDYEVKLLTFGTSGEASFSVDSVALTSPNAAPSADAGDNQTVTVGNEVSFDGSGSSDADGDNLTYSWDFDGDDSEDATGAKPTHTYDSSGTYTATLTVTDEHGATATDTVTVTAEETTYDVTFNVTDEDGNASANATVNVTQNDSEVATATTDANGSAVVALSDGDYSYSISSEDGNLSASGDVSVDGSAQTVDVSLSEDTGTGVIGPIPDDQTNTVIAIVLLGAGVILVIILFRD